MQNALVLSAIIGPVYLIFGLSILIYVKQWKKIMAEFSKNHFQMLYGMMMAVIFGLVIITIYNVWEWNLYLIITLTGWSALIKGIFYFLAPSSWIKKVMGVKWMYSEASMYFWGAVATIVGILLSYNVYLA